MNFDTARLMALIDLVADERIEELQIIEGNVEYHLVLHANDRTAPAQAAEAPTTPSAAQDRAPEPKPMDVAGSHHLLVAPMSGTFYRAAGGGAQPLVELGARVEAGTPVCIVEAMKIMNEVVADRAGRIARILAQEGQPVEQDQPLFEIAVGD